MTATKEDSLIKFTGISGKKGERGVIGIALSRSNCDRLVAGEPILFRTEDINIDGFDVLIVGGEDEVTILNKLTREMKKSGADVFVLDRRFPDPDDKPS